MEKTIQKVMMVGFVSGAFLVGYAVHVISTLLASSWGTYARLANSELVSNGLPVVFGFAFFAFVMASKTVKSWAQEVVVEVSKVVWPSQKDTTAMTIFVCFFMIISGLILGFFDYISSQVIQFIIELS